MKKIIFGLALTLSGLLGVVGLIVGILISLGCYAGYYGDMLFYGFVNRFNLETIFFIFILLWAIGIFILGKECFKKDTK